MLTYDKLDGSGHRGLHGLSLSGDGEIRLPGPNSHDWEKQNYGTLWPEL